MNERLKKQMLKTMEAYDKIQESVTAGYTNLEPAKKAHQEEWRKTNVLGKKLGYNSFQVYDLWIELCNHLGRKV